MKRRIGDYLAKMEVIRSKRSTVAVNVMIAIVISIVINFSYVLSVIVEQRYTTNENRVQEEQVYRPEAVGVMSISRDGYGYLVGRIEHKRGEGWRRVDGHTLQGESISIDAQASRESEQGDKSRAQFKERDSLRGDSTHRAMRRDSIYISHRRIMHYNLKHGDTVRCTVYPPQGNSNPTVERVLMQNGVVPQPVMYDRPRYEIDMIWQMLFYFTLSFLLLTIMTARFGKGDSAVYKYYMWRCIAVFTIALIFFFAAPFVNWRTGKVMMMFQRDHFYMDWMVILKCLSVTAIAILYGRIYALIFRQQQILLENEHLHNENLRTRYNMLVGQINPHFFFNSLNSLSMLVRERDEDKAIRYIDQLSFTFRYIIQNGQNTNTTLAEEMKFAAAYGELFKVRYADKFFIDVDIEKEYESWVLPALTLQPLIGNAVKHNSITRKNPLHISIRTQGAILVVSNVKAPKLETEASTGIGLKNLRSRWQLINGNDIEIIDGEKEFIIRMPLQKPDAQ